MRRNRLDSADDSRKYNKFFQVVQVKNCSEKSLDFVVQTLIAANNHNMFFSLRSVEKSRNQIAVLRNAFCANRANSFYPRLANWKTIWAAAHRTSLIRNVHRTIDFADYVLTFQKGGAANRAIYKRGARRIFFRKFF